MNDKCKPKKNLSASQKKRNRKQSSIRARVEHVFRVIKQQFGFKKIRYRGLKKKISQVHMFITRTNLYMLRGGYLRDHCVFRTRDKVKI
nr:transposase [Mariprofundus sp. EBB-1]